MDTTNSADLVSNIAKTSKIDLYKHFKELNYIDPSTYDRFDVKRGLRNADGSGVIAGLTNISNVHGYLMSDGIKIPDKGVLSYRGYDINELIGESSSPKRFRFEEITSLLLSGRLPTQKQLDKYVAAIDSQRELPNGFTSYILLRDTPPDIMNVLQRSLQLLYAFDLHAEERSSKHEVLTAVSLLSRLPRIMVLSYYSMRARYNNESFIMHPFIPGQSTAETILSMLRPDRQFKPEEAEMLDVMLCLHAEHGGGNNSTFTLRVISSSDTDPYSAYAAALGSLKGKRHGGANEQVRALHEEIKRKVTDWENDDEIANYLTKVVEKKAFDKTGLIYGIGHAVYTISDPRAIICKQFARRLAAGTKFEAEFNLLERIEQLAPEILKQEKGSDKDFCANIDMYSGFVYHMIGIPKQLYTPLFACSRMAGWAAHRFEEILSGKRIIRPAYKSANTHMRSYVPIEERE